MALKKIFCTWSFCKICYRFHATWIDSGVSYRIVNGQLRLMGFYFFPSLHLSQLVRKNMRDLYSVHNLLPGVLPRFLLRVQASLQTPFGLAVPFSKGGCMAGGVKWHVVTWSPRPSAVPRDPAASPAVSPSLGTASVFCLLNLSWRSPSAGWQMGRLLAWDASCSQEGWSPRGFGFLFFFSYQWWGMIVSSLLLQQK